jgi:hypothetical protein
MKIKLLRKVGSNNPGEVIDIPYGHAVGLCMFGDAVVVVVVEKPKQEPSPTPAPQQVPAPPPAPGHPAHKRETPTRRPQETRKSKQQARKR